MSLNQAKEILSDANQFVESTLRLGVIPTIAPYILPAYLDKLSTEYPKLKILVREDLTDNLFKLLKAGSLDLLLLAIQNLVIYLTIAYSMARASSLITTN